MVRSIVVQLFFCLGMPLLASRAAAQGDSALESAAGAVETALPANAEDLASADPALLDRSRAQLEEAAAQLVAQIARQDGAAVVAQMRRLLRAGDHVAGLTARLLELRRTIAAQPPEQQLQAARGFLRCAAGMIDLSGRLRYVQYDAFHTACERLATDTRQFDRLVALAREYRSSIGAVVLVVAVDLLKDAIDRPRPLGGHDTVEGSAFPSGHAAYATAWVAVAVVAARVVPGLAHGAALVASGVAICVVVGLTRIYLGVHYLSDVVAGWALGATAFGSVAAAFVLASHLRTRRSALGAAGGVRASETTSSTGKQPVVDSGPPPTPVAESSPPASARAPR